MKLRHIEAGLLSAVVFLATCIVASRASASEARGAKIADEVRQAIQEYVYFHEAARLVRLDNDQSGDVQSRRALKSGRQNMDDRINVVVEVASPESLRTYHFYRAYNSNIVPAWVYTMAVGPAGELYRLGGFEGDDFNRMLGVLMSGSTQEDLLTTMHAYYRLAQGFEPGLLRNLKDVATAREAISASTALTVNERERALRALSVPRVDSSGTEQRLTATVFDSRSLRLERYKLRLSLKGGLTVESKEVVLDRYRLTY